MTTPWEDATETGRDAHFDPSDLRDRVNGARAAHQPPKLEAVRGDATTIRRTRWAWQDWAPLGSFLVVAGEPAAGKGVMTCYLLAEPHPGHRTRGSRRRAGERDVGRVRGQLAGNDPP